MNSTYTKSPSVRLPCTTHLVFTSCPSLRRRPCGRQRCPIVPPTIRNRVPLEHIARSSLLRRPLVDLKNNLPSWATPSDLDLHLSQATRVPAHLPPGAIVSTTRRKEDLPGRRPSLEIKTRSQQARPWAHTRKSGSGVASRIDRH